MDFSSDFLNSFEHLFATSPILDVLVAVLLFLAIREIVTWYWKQNEIVDLLKKIEKNTRKPNAQEQKTDEIDVEKATSKRISAFTDSK